MPRKRGQSPNRHPGVLINNRTGLQVDLFIVKSEEVEISNKITGDQIPDRASISEHVKFEPMRLSVEGQLVPNTYDNPHESKDHMPVEKLKRLISFCNDKTTDYKLICPSLPFTFLDVFPTNFVYRGEGASNAANFGLDLEEVALAEALPERGATKGYGNVNIRGYSPNSQASGVGTASLTAGSGTEDGGTKAVAGEKPLKSLWETISPQNLEQAVEKVKQGYGTMQALTSEAMTAGIGGKIGKWLGATAGSMIAGSPGSRLGAQLGQAIGKPLGNLTFPAISPISRPLVSTVESVKDLPVVGTLIHNLLGLPGDTEFLLEVRRKNQATTLLTMRSPIFRRLRSAILDKGFEKMGMAGGRTTTLKEKRILTTEENRTLRRAFQTGIEELGLLYKNHSSLRDFITQTPQISSPQGLTFFNYYGQPVMSFQGFLDVNFENWNASEISLNGEDVTMEVFWNRTGFPVFSFFQSDGTPLTKEIKGTLGSDILDPLQGLAKFNGIHIIPISLTGKGTMTKEGIEDDIELMVVYTNRKGLEGIL